MGVLGHASRWRKLRPILAAALDLERGRIGAEQSSYVIDYLDHNEFGLAYDQLIDALSDLELAPLDTTRPLLAEAARLMDRS
jgi:hypothetical protein